MERPFLLTTCLLCLSFLGGCIFPYCAYPRLDYTPRVKLDSPPNEVRAFRVDISKPTADGSVFTGPVYERLSEVPVTNTDEIPPQIKPSVTYGFVVIGIALNYLTHTSHSIALRLYRPGYALAEIKSWERFNRVAWKSAPDLEAHEKALDSLFPEWRLEAGSTAPAHREALRFGASEYERLAEAATATDQQTRLAAKATKLRERANE